MSSRSRVVAIIGLIAILLISSIAAVFLYLNTGPKTLEVEFSPQEINTSPDETGWFLVQIETNVPIVNYEVSIQTNVSIETDYTLWSETPLLEVFLHPNSSHIESCIEVEVTFSTGGLAANDSALLHVLNWTFEDLPEVIEKRDVFIDYLMDNHPELGIGNTTIWEPIYNGAGILIVGHYLFKSSEWEMEVSWHVMIQPHDWVRVYLRNRADLQPSWAGEIESWGSGDLTIVEIDSPDEIYRAQ